MQHPEVVGLLPEEYDEFILSPLDCILEKIIPRQFKALSCENGAAFATELYKSLFLKNADNAIQLAARQKILDKYGYFGGTPTNNTEAPMDFLGDQLRSFSGILSDIRRRPEKVLESADALYPFTGRAGLGENPTPQTRAEYPLHMATYMKEKDFAKFW